jgi:23S rRNA G2445 N2-methylase RlmL
MIEAAKARVKRRVPMDIVATDKDAQALDAAKSNAEKAGVAKHIDFLRCDFKVTPISDGGGTVILNPEYGSRLGEVEELEGTYKEIGDFFKQRCAGYAAFVFSGNLDLIKKIGLRPAKKTPFLNGTIECRLLRYEMYSGSQKDTDAFDV